MKQVVTESQLKRIIMEAVKQITDGVLSGSMDIPGYRVKKDLDALVSYVDKMAEKYSDLYDETGDGLYDSFCDRLYSLSENLGRFLKGEGYDSFMRKPPEI